MFTAKESILETVKKPHSDVVVTWTDGIVGCRVDLKDSTGDEVQWRTIKLLGVEKSLNDQELLRAVFSRILSFDGNRLSHRARNRFLVCIRRLLPPKFTGTLSTQKGIYTTTVIGKQLCVYGRNQKLLAKMDYFKFSKIIKGSLT